MRTNGRSRPSWLQPLDKDLLETARSLHRDGHPSAAVVTAHAATEVVSEFVIEAFFELRDVPELRDPISELARLHLSKDTRVRRLYEVLSGDDIGTTDLWRRFCEHIDRR